MKTAIVYSNLSSDASLDNQDTLVQLEEISQALQDMGRDVKHFAFDVNVLDQSLRDFNPEFIFNLVETVEGKDALSYIATSYFDKIGIPYTGCNTHSLKVLADKIQLKEILREGGLPTADFFTLDTVSSVSDNQDISWIVKSATEHASIGIDANSIVKGRAAAVLKIKEKQSQYSGVWFAERFIEGREFNISVLEKADHTGADVLPPAEIRFIDYPEGMPKIVDYAAKWEEGSFGYHATPRSFDFPASDNDLLKELNDICLACWDLFSLTGCVRVDFRVDENGRPWILELNANPCLSSDAGFMAASAQAGLQPIDVIKRLTGKKRVS